ncbi:hypothetical protein [Thiolapillus sp.]
MSQNLSRGSDTLVLKRADVALYKAKQQGRNKVIVFNARKSA